MSRLLSISEYADATIEIQRLQSELAESELKALRKAIAELKTARGIVEQKRKANTKASRYIATAKTAERIAGLAQLNSKPEDTLEAGRARLEAATEECFPGYLQREKDREQKRAEKRGQPFEHGLKAYRSGICRCAAICTPANAKATREQRRKKKQRDHDAKQHTGQTTEGLTAARNGGQETLAGSKADSPTAGHSEPLRTAHSAAA